MARSFDSHDRKDKSEIIFLQYVIYLIFPTFRSFPSKLEILFVAAFQILDDRKLAKAETEYCARGDEGGGVSRE